MSSAFQHRSQQVVGRADGVEVASEMKVDVLHGDDLGVAAASRTALDAKYRAQGGLTETEHGIFVQFRHGVGQTYAGGGLALAGRSGVDGSDQDQLGFSGGVLEGADVDLRLHLAVVFQQIFVNAGLFRHLANGKHLCALSNLNVSFHVQIFLSNI